MVSVIPVQWNHDTHDKQHTERNMLGRLKEEKQKWMEQCNKELEILVQEKCREQ